MSQETSLNMKGCSGWFCQLRTYNKSCVQCIYADWSTVFHGNFVTSFVGVDALAIFLIQSIDKQQGKTLRHALLVTNLAWYPMYVEHFCHWQYKALSPWKQDSYWPLAFSYMFTKHVVYNTVCMKKLNKWLWLWLLIDLIGKTAMCWYKSNITNNTYKCCNSS